MPAPNHWEYAKEICSSCGHLIEDHAEKKCNGVYNVYDVHGDETVGCLCPSYKEVK